MNIIIEFNKLSNYINFIIITSIYKIELLSLLAHFYHIFAHKFCFNKN